MTTIIGSVTLDRDMVFENEYLYSKVFVSTARTLGGGLIVQEFPASEKGRMIILSSTESQGFQSKSTVDSLMALAEQVGATYPLIILSNSKTFSKTVRFVNEESNGPVQFEPIQVIDGLSPDTMLYKGKIYLMVV